MTDDDNVTIYKTVNTGLYGDRAYEFFNWLKFEFLEKYDYMKSQVGSHTANSVIGALLIVERASDNEIILNIAKSMCRDSAIQPLSSFWLKNNYYKRKLAIDSVHTNNRLGYMDYSLPRKYLTMFGTQDDIRKYLAKYIKVFVADSNIQTPGLATIFKDCPFIKINKISAVDAAIDRQSDEVLIDFSYSSVINNPLVELRKKYVKPTIDTIIGVSKSLPTRNIKFTSAELAFMFDYLMGHKIDDSKYENVNIQDFKGVANNPVEVEFEKEYQNALAEANKKYKLELKEAELDCSKEQQRLYDKYLEQLNAYREKVLGEVSARYNAAVNQANALKQIL